MCVIISKGQRPESERQTPIHTNFSKNSDFSKSLLIGRRASTWVVTPATAVAHSTTCVHLKEQRHHAPSEVTMHQKDMSHQRDPSRQPRTQPNFRENAAPLPRRRGRAFRRQGQRPRRYTPASAGDAAQRQAARPTPARARPKPALNRTRDLTLESEV